jgi:isoquinoline 1-oxidoreductase beta subunit
VEQGDFDTYRTMRIDEVPVTGTHLVKSTEVSGGIGETGTAAVAPAVSVPSPLLIVGGMV